MASNDSKNSGNLLFYGRAVDNTMLVALGTIAAAQTHGTETTMDVVQLLNYAATHPDRYHNSDMILYVHSDAVCKIFACNSIDFDPLNFSQMKRHLFLL
jgi:hypothetical protein